MPSVGHVVCRIVGLFGRQYGTDEKTEYTVTEFASTTIPETIPAEGGAYTMTFTTRTETRSQPVVPVFEPWQYRVTLGEAVGDAIAVTEPKTEVSVVIGSNYSKEPRAVVVEMAVTEDAATPPGGFGSSRLNRSLP